MSSEAAVCPHCGARAAGSPTKIADVKLSPAEIRALISADTAKRGLAAAPRGLVHTLLVPHPRTAGGARVTEIALTIAALPIIVCGLLPLVGIRRVTRGRVTDSGGEAGTVLTVSVSGGVTLISLLAETALSIGAIAIVIGAQVVLLVSRSVVRSRAEASRELMRLAKHDD
jgi:hypothetical protein